MITNLLLQPGRFDPVDGVIIFAVSLLIGGAAIHVTAKQVMILGQPSGLPFEHSLFTALLGAIVWAALSWIPLLGPLLGLVGWVAVIRWRYPGDWVKAGVTGAAAWAAAVVALAVLELIGFGSVSALGVPLTS